MPSLFFSLLEETPHQHNCSPPQYPSGAPYINCPPQLQCKSCIIQPQSCNLWEKQCDCYCACVAFFFRLLFNTWNYIVSVSLAYLHIIQEKVACIVLESSIIKSHSHMSGLETRLWGLFLHENGYSNTATDSWVECGCEWQVWAH